MTEVKWIKIVVNIFDDDKIKLIEALPDGDSIIVCWFKLLCLAGQKNNFGILMLNDRIAYTDEMLATVFRRPLQTVRLALETFEQFGMVEIVNGAITIPNWEKHQNLDKLQELREYNRLAQQKSRAKRKELLAVNDMSMTSQSRQDTDIDIEKDIDKEILTETNVSVCRTKDVRRVMEAWNSLGLQQLREIKGDTKRGGMLRARVNEYGVDAVLEAIENVRKSSFLKGQNSKGWTITFEWFVAPNNFIKVLEGNYDDTKAPAPQAARKPKKRSQFQTAAEYAARPNEIEEDKLAAIKAAFGME